MKLVEQKVHQRERHGLGAVAKDAAILEQKISIQWTLASLSVSMLLSSLGTSSANVALPTISRAFEVSFQQVQWVVLAYLLTLTVLLVMVGRLGDVVGRRRLLLIGLLLFTAASVLCGLAPTLWMLVVARAVQGLGAAIMMTLTLASVGELVPKAKIGSAMGLLGTMSAVGTALGPSLGGVLLSSLGWRAIFLANVPLGILAMVLAYRYLPADPARRKTGEPGLDLLGTLLLALTLAAYALAMTLGRGRLGPLNLVLLITAVIGGGIFVLAESRTASPLVPLMMLRNRVLSGSLCISMLVSTVVMTTLIAGPFYLSRALGLDAALVGIVMSAGPLTVALTGVPAGRLVDRLGPQRMAPGGLAGMATGCLLLVMMPPRWGIIGYVLGILVITASYAQFQAANNTAVMTNVEPEQRGVVSGMLNLSRNLGLITGASFMGVVFALGVRAHDISTALPGAVAIGMRVTFAVATVLVVAGLAVSLWLGRKAGRSQ